MRGPTDKQAGRSLKPILGVAAAICALLMASAAVGAQSAQPGDALWGLTKVLYSSHAESVQAKIAATQSMDSADIFLNAGKTTEAVTALSSASGEVQKVDVSDGRDQLQVHLSKLQARVDGVDLSGTAGLDASTAAGRAAAAGGGAIAGSKSNSGVAKHSTPSAVGRAGTNTNAGKPGVTSANGPTGPSQDGSITATVPGAPIVPLPTDGQTEGNSSNPGTQTVAPVDTVPVAPVTGPTDVGSTTDTGTSTTSEVPPPVTTDAPTTPDPSTTSDPPTTDPSTTSQMPTPTPTPTTDGGTGTPGNNGAPSVGDNANASQ